MSELDGQTEDFYYLRLVLDIYRAVRQNGGSLDVVGIDDALAGYDLILLPSLLCVSDEMITRIKASGARVLAGPRTGLKTQDFQLPDTLTSSPLAEMTGFTTQRIDALPARLPHHAKWRDHDGTISIWREEGVVTGQSEGQCDDGLPLLTHGNQGSYVTAWPDEGLLKAIIGNAMQKAGIACHDMPAYLRVRQRGEQLIFTHYGPEQVTIPDSFTGEILLGSRVMSQTDVTIIKQS